MWNSFTSYLPIVTRTIASNDSDIHTIYFLVLRRLSTSSTYLPTTCHQHKNPNLIYQQRLTTMDCESDSSDLTDLSSELSSVRSRSPSPVFGYPSPQSSRERPSNVPSSQPESRKRPQEFDDASPAKKRKSIEAKPRTTVHLALSASGTAIDQNPQLQLLLKNLRKRRKIVVIAGAGISTSAGSECCQQ